MHQPPPTFQRLTTTYVPEEDRIRLAGQLADHTTAVLWCTQRLLRGLLPPLWSWAENRARHLPNKEAYLEFLQASAQARLTPTPPVATKGGETSWLVLAVDLQADEAAVRLTFRGPEDHAATLLLAEVPLRQWLGILRGLFCSAGWSLEDWPSWLISQEITGAAPCLQ